MAKQKYALNNGEKIVSSTNGAGKSGCTRVNWTLTSHQIQKLA